jgi:hypothetical protein
VLTLAQSIAHFRARLFEKSSARPARRLALRCGLPLGVLAMQSLQGIVIGGVVLSPDAAWAQGDGAANAAAVAGTPLPLSRITLYRSGVASMERKGTVNGDANVQLTFRADQINDILKSMIVLDQGGGTVRSVEYASQEGLQRRLASFGIDLSDNPSASDLLARLRGTAVRIVTADGKIEGTVLNVESRATVLAGKDGSSVENLPWINLVTSGGVRSVNLTTSTGFEILDTELAAELNKALAAIAEMRSEQRKTVNISFEGNGDRPVMAAYVQESPVWKTTYRLALPEDESNPVMQGWAIVENTSEEDWIDVTLSLASGQPSAFRMNLYEPLFTTRPQISVPVPVMTVARAFDAGMDMEGGSRVAVSSNSAPRVAGGDYKDKAGKPAAGAPMMRAAPGSPRGTTGSAEMLSMGESAPAGDPGAGGIYGGIADAGSAASTMQTGDVFFFQIDQPVTVQRKRSAMLPIVSQQVEGSRVSIITADQYSGFAMRGVRIKNNVGMQMVAGPVAVFDGNIYAGDAQLNDLGQSQNALLGYATDTDVKVLRSDDQVSASRTIRIVKGVLETRVRTQYNTTYNIDNGDSKKGRTMIIEVARLPGGELVKPSTALETTPAVHRFEVKIEKGSEGKASKSAFTVTQSRTDASSASLFDYDIDSLAYMLSNATLSPAMKQAFDRISQIRSTMNDAMRREAALEQERGEITTEQDRIRQNLGSLDRTSELAVRLTRKLGDQETRLDAITGEIAAARSQAQKARAELETYLSSLNIDE